MNIFLIQVDGKWPNLALMKISALHKEKGDEVYFRKNCTPDVVYLSCIFPKNRSQALGIARMFPQAEIHLGGSGINYTKLPSYIESMCPDYDLYGIDYSMGFTSRGCIRNCSWCIIPKKEGCIKNHQSLQTFLRHKKLILLDSNFLASPKCYENLQELIDLNVKINFSQGLDIRLINDDNAKLLSQIKFFTHTFKSKYLHFAFDDPNIEKYVRQGLDILLRHNIRSYSLMFYVLCGYNTSHEEDMHRFNILKELGCQPFIMKYNNRQDDRWLNHFARWVNKRVYNVCSWEDYDVSDSQKIINY